MSTDPVVTIAGAGIGGLSAAIALHRAGVQVSVVEQAEELHEIGAAIGVQTNAMRMLRTLDLAHIVQKRSAEIESYDYMSWRGRRLVRWSPGEIGRRHGEPTVVIHRADLQQTLQEALPDGILRFDARCVGYTEDPAGVTVQLADGTEMRSAVLVGADGFRSVVRRTLLGEEDPRYSGWMAYRGIADFRHLSFPFGFARQFIGRGRTFGMWHLTDGRVYWVGTHLEPAESTVDGSRRDRALGLFGSAGHPARELIEATEETAILRHPVFDRPPARRWSSGRVVLVGDAAHPMTPVTGQGGGQAIIDAGVLAEHLGAQPDLAGEAVATAFARYEARRRGVASEITNEAWAISRLYHVRNPLVCALRDLSFRLTPTGVWHKRMERRIAY